MFGYSSLAFTFLLAYKIYSNGSFMSSFSDPLPSGHYCNIFLMNLRNEIFSPPSRFSSSSSKDVCCTSASNTKLPSHINITYNTNAASTHRFIEDLPPPENWALSNNSLGGGSSRATILAKWAGVEAFLLGSLSLNRCFPSNKSQTFNELVTVLSNDRALTIKPTPHISLFSSQGMPRAISGAR